MAPVPRLAHRRPPVQHHAEPVAKHPDHHHVPAPAGMRQGQRDWRDVDDCAGSVGRIGPPVEDVDLIGIVGGNRGTVLAAQENAAIGVFADPEFGAQVEIPVALPRHEKADPATVGGDQAMFHAPIGVAKGCPAGQGPAVEQPPYGGAGEGWRGQQGCRSRAKQEGPAVAHPAELRGPAPRRNGLNASVRMAPLHSGARYSPKAGPGAPGPRQRRC